MKTHHKDMFIQQIIKNDKDIKEQIDKEYKNTEIKWKLKKVLDTKVKKKKEIKLEGMQVNRQWVIRKTESK